jgi:hypothetical protein
MSHAGMKDAQEKKTTRLNNNPKPAETINQSLSNGLLHLFQGHGVIQQIGQLS